MINIANAENGFGARARAGAKARAGAGEKKKSPFKEIEFKTGEIQDLLAKYGLSANEDYSFRFDKAKDSFFVTPDSGYSEQLIGQAKRELKYNWNNTPD